MRRVAGWLWHEQPISLPGWIILLAAWWAISGTFEDLVHLSEWLLKTL
jgi:hypothetical protein